MLYTSFTPFPLLETENLVLRQIVDTDVEEVFSLRSNKNVMKYIARSLHLTKDDALEHIEKLRELKDKEEAINWAITLKNNTKLIGIAGLFRINKENYRAEIGYMLNPEFHRKGIITETIQKIIEFGFMEINLHSITAIIDPRNIASQRVLEKAKFIKEAHFKEDCYFEGTFLDSAHYSLLNKK